MAQRSASICNGPGCQRRTVAGRRYCPTCNAAFRQRERARKRAADAARPSSDARGYDRRWRRIRLGVLAEHPFCQTPGCPWPASEVDHIVPLSAGGTHDRDNLQALCKRCHSAKTMGEYNRARGGE